MPWFSSFSPETLRFQTSACSPFLDVPPLPCPHPQIVDLFPGLVVLRWLVLPSLVLPSGRTCCIGFVLSGLVGCRDLFGFASPWIRLLAPVVSGMIPSLLLALPCAFSPPTGVSVPGLFPFALTFAVWCLCFVLSSGCWWWVASGSFLQSSFGVLGIAARH